MEDKMIEIARFGKVSEAEMLVSLLKSEGIDCYVRDGISSGIFFNNENIAGAKVELLAKDAEHATEIMKAHGYEVQSETLEMIESENSPEDEEEYERSKKTLTKRMTVILILMIIVLIAIFVLNNYFNG